MLAAAVLIVVPLQSSCTLAGAARGSSMPPHRSHRVPYPNAPTPNVVHVSWKINAAKPAHRTIHNASSVVQVYGQICGLTLIRYDHPLAVACPLARHMAVYHLRFRRGSRIVLRVTEKAVGCYFLSVDGRSDLGSTMLMGSLVLPQGIPAVSR